MKQPSMRRHATGVFFTKWAGKNWYFTKNQRESEHQFTDPDSPHPGSLRNWMEWRKAKKGPAVHSGPITIGQLYDNFLEAKRGEVEPMTLAYYKYHLGRTVATFGRMPAQSFAAPMLSQLKNIMVARKLKPATIRHDIIAVRTLFSWGYDNGYLREPVWLKGVKAPKLGEPKPKAYSVEKIRAMVERAQRNDERLVPWLLLNYLAALRPSEVVRLVRGDGSFEEPGIFRLDKSKSEKMSGIARRLVLSDKALEIVKAARPHWATPSGYYQACVDAAIGGTAGPLRHSAATHLGALGVDRASIDLILGHMPARVSLIYAPVSWQDLRAKVSKLTL